jgi:hypothetical protein
MKERDHLEDLERDGRYRAQTGLIWLRIRTSGGVLTNAVMNLVVPQNAGNFLTTWVPGSFSRTALRRGVRYLATSLVS